MNQVLMNDSNPSNSRKALWVLVAFGVVAMVETIAVSVIAWKLAHQRKQVSAVQIEPVISAPIVFSHDITTTETRHWAIDVPHGTQVLNGVTFLCDGAVRTGGLRGRKHPGAVLGIPIHRKGTRIHLLQCAENLPGNQVGTPYGRVRFHFADGQTRDFYLRFGVHGRDWFQVRRQLDDGVNDPNTEVAWLAEKEPGKVWVRLWHTTLANPLPSQEITSVDAISVLGEGNLLLFAITIDNATTPLQPPFQDEWTPEMLNLEFALQKSDGTPVSNGSVRWKAFLAAGTNRTGRALIDFPPFPCDSSGRVSIDFPTRAISEIRYIAADQAGTTATGTVAQPVTGWPVTQKITVVVANK